MSEERNCFCDGQIELPDFAIDLSNTANIDIVIEDAPELADFLLPQLPICPPLQPVPTFNCFGANPNCSECCNILSSGTARANFGILPEFLGPQNVQCLCRDICVQEVRLICATPIRKVISIGQVGGRCRGIIPCNLPVTGCTVFVARANEELNATCTGVDFCVDVAIELMTPSGNTCIVQPITGTCTRFFPFPSGAAISGNALRQALTEIDGSCIVVQLACNVSGNVATGERFVIVSGNIVEKLWKEENLLVSAIRPFGGITVKEVFSGNIIPTCSIGG